MKRNDFASGNKAPKNVPPKKPEAEKMEKKSKLTGKKMVGDGHKALKQTYLSDDFIKKLDEYLPKK